MWNLSSMRLGNKSTRTEQKGKFKKTLLFLKRIVFELIRNIMHQMKSLRDSFIPPQRAIHTLHYPGYVKRLQKERRIQAKRKNLHEKICMKTMPQPINIKMFNKNIEIFNCVSIK